MGKKHFPIAIAFAVLSGCGFLESDKADRSPFLGEWESSQGFEYTVADSLYRDSLDKYMSERGIDLEAYFDPSSEVPRDSRKFDSLLKAFDWECPSEAHCSTVLWVRTIKKRFTADSVFELTFKDAARTDSFSYAYRFTRDSLFMRFAGGDLAPAPYEFKPGGDTLILAGSLDTLVRLK